MSDHDAILTDARATFPAHAETITLVIEHGQSWIVCGCCDAAWSVCVPVGFEQVSLGDGFCDERASEEG